MADTTVADAFVFRAGNVEIIFMHLNGTTE
jgi:hypothetical protein